MLSSILTIDPGLLFAFIMLLIAAFLIGMVVANNLAVSAKPSKKDRTHKLTEEQAAKLREAAAAYDNAHDAANTKFWDTVHEVVPEIPRSASLTYVRNDGLRPYLRFND